MLHNWCFTTKNPVFKYFETEFSVSLFTGENRYDLDPSKVVINEIKDEVVIEANGLQWAGGQMDEPGYVKIVVQKGDSKVNFSVTAKMDQVIKKIKLELFNRRNGSIVGRRRYEVTPSTDGIIMNYPNGWDDLFTPLFVVKGKDFFDYYRILDSHVRPKHFAVTKLGEGLRIELVYEEDASYQLKEITVDGFEIGQTPSIDDIFENQKLFNEKAFNLVKWEDRKDVPDWAKKMSLIISLHGMHWSGYIFNTYAQMEEKLEWLAKRCDASSTCVYIPGFDGRYYFKYPNYDPDPRMGGEEGLKKLMDHAHKLGFHVMPMFMINGANPATPGFDDWGQASRYHGANGYVHGVGSCDWDTGRWYDLGCGIGLNPGAKKWQDYFVAEASKQIEKFGFDSIFLDLAAIYHNDPTASTHDGAIQIINRLHEKFPSLLIATEGCYDALSIAFPLSQCAGEASRQGEQIYHDTPYAPIFTDYNRCFGHLCLGAPGNFKNGVFEWGFNPAEQRLPIRKGIIPTITIVDDTIEKFPDLVEEYLKDAVEYKNKFLK